jgi:hypothetical protein
MIKDGPAVEGAWRQALLDATAHHLAANGRTLSPVANARYPDRPADIISISALAIVCEYSKPLARALDVLKLELDDIRDWESRPQPTQDQVVEVLRRCAGLL